MVDTHENQARKALGKKPNMSSHTERPRLVFVARRAPWPLDNGARIRAYHLLAGLSATFDTAFVCYEHAPGSPDGHTDAAELRRQFPGVQLVTTAGLGPRKRVAQAASFLSQRSWSFGRYRQPEFAALLVRTVEQRLPCVVHFDDLGVAQLGPLEGVVNAYSAHNVEQRIVRLNARTGSAPRRLFNAIESRKVRREEERVWRSMDLSLAVSPLDAAAMRSGGAARVELCPNGTEPIGPLSIAPLVNGDPLRILFVGSGAYAPYERGLAWFVKEVLPRASARTPLRFDVVGQRPSRPIEAAGVSYSGRVPSVAPFYERAHVVVVPVFEGSGTRLKMLEAVAYGRPVVSTRLGAEGLPLTAGEHYLEADDPEAFAAAIGGLANRLRDPSDTTLERMLKAARESIEPLFWPNVVDRLATMYLNELEGLPTGAPTEAVAGRPL